MSEEDKADRTGTNTEDYSTASHSMPDIGAPNSVQAIDGALGTEPGTGIAPDEATELGVDADDPDAGLITQDYSDTSNPGTTTIDEEFAGGS